MEDILIFLRKNCNASRTLSFSKGEDRKFPPLRPSQSLDYRIWLGHWLKENRALRKTQCAVREVLLHFQAVVLLQGHAQAFFKRDLRLIVKQFFRQGQVGAHAVHATRIA